MGVGMLKVTPFHSSFILINNYDEMRIFIFIFLNLILSNFLDWLTRNVYLL